MSTHSRHFHHLAAVVLLAAGPAMAHDGEPGQDGHHAPVPEAEAHRPSAIPDRIILTWVGDPSGSMAVTWRTDPSVTSAVAQIAPAADNRTFEDRARTVDAETTAIETDLGPAHHHTARFEGLEPSTSYLYRVGDGVNWSAWIRFNTLAEGPEPFSFIYFGDAQNDVKSHWSRVIRQAYSDAPKALFMLHAGDLINSADADAEWGDWFRAGGWVNAMVPSIATPGNHEYGRRVDDTKGLSDHWRPQFALPENGPPGLEETVYWIDVQGARIVSLNSNERREEQVDWLRSVLADNPNRWTILTFHHPIRSSARGRDNAELRRLWQPVFDEYAVDLVLQGHDHTYARSGLETFEENLPQGAGPRSSDAGTVYVVSVSGPKMYDVDREEWMRRAGHNVQLYQIITVDGPTLGYQARTATGAIYDAFTLRKRDDGPNELIDAIPDDVPERLGRDDSED